MKDLVKNAGEFNNWKGCMGLFFTQKSIRPLKKLGITTETPIRDAYRILSNL